MHTFNLLMLPFAGGSKYSYRAYEERSPGLFRIIALDYPGRGARSSEPLIHKAADLAEDVYYQARHIINNEQPYALFGHSMGGLMSYLLTRIILQRGDPPPLHLFVTGTAGPSALADAGNKLHLLDSPAFLDEIINLNGCPKELRENKELLQYFEPILRADFTIAETYSHQPQAPMHVPITAITGSDEELTQEEIRSWQQVTCRPVDFRQMQGDHFFILNHVDAIIRIVTKKLSAHLKYS